MYCPNCGRQIPDYVVYCPACGNKIIAPVNPNYNYNTYPTYNQPPKEPSTIIPLLLGMFLGIIGVLIAVLVYNGNDGPYTKNPTTHALVWSLIGMFIWIPITYIIIFVLFMPILYI